tara:strand:+ start:472 stop:1281 length:810 start_codon:yes stop_codon:yes gene_type:complete
MAQFIDERQEEELNEDEELGTFDDSQEITAEEPDTEDEAPESESVPNKYNGKSITDIVAMHQNAESLLGKQGQEVGELRKIVDDFIKSQTVDKTAQLSSDDDDNDIDFFENPKKSMQRMLDEHPALKESKQMASEMRKNETLSKIKVNHPDFMDVLADDAFGEWVSKSKIRSQMLQHADKNYDYDSADELLSLWKDRKGAINTTLDSEKKARKQSVKTASTGTANGSGERPSRKIYRRADIIDLMRKDPERYESLMPEIRKAYSEGRVK